MAFLNAVCAEFATGGKLNNAEGAAKIKALIGYLFPESFQQAAFNVYLKYRESFIPFAPQACIAMTEACLRYCSRTGGIQFEKPNKHEDFVRVLLSFHEHMFSGALLAGLNPQALRKDQFRFFTRNFLAANLQTGFQELTRRNYMMFGLSNPGGVLETRANNIATPAWLESVVGVSPAVYGTMMLFTLHHGNEFKLDAPDLRHLIYDLESMLREVKPEVAKIYRELHQLAVVDSVLEDANYEDWESAVYAAHYIRRKPILCMGGSKFLCLYKHLMAEKFFGGTVHVLTEFVSVNTPLHWSNEPRERRLRVRREFGYIFEDYLRRLLGEIFHTKSCIKEYGFPLKDGGECDAIILVDKIALVFEFVHHPWSLSERSSGDAERFAYHLKDNIQKLEKTCRQIQSFGEAANRQVTATSIVPIVVTSEMVPINEFTSSTFEAELVRGASKEFIRGHINTEALQILSVSQIESLDRVETLDTPEQTAAFLLKRSRDPLWRLTGQGDLRQKTDESRRLKRYSEESENIFLHVAPQLFLQKL